jgi:hypothetical protein
MLALKFTLIYMLGAVVSFTILFVVTVHQTNWKSTTLLMFIADTKDLARFALAWPVSSLALILAMVLPEINYRATKLIERFAIMIYRDRTK